MNLPFHGKCIYHPKHNKEIMNNQLTKPFMKSMPKGSYKKIQHNKYKNFQIIHNNRTIRETKSAKETKVQKQVFGAANTSSFFPMNL